MIENEIKKLFDELGLGRVKKIIKSDLKWAHGEVYFVTTWLKKYIVHEMNGTVKSIKNNYQYFYEKARL